MLGDVAKSLSLSLLWDGKRQGRGEERRIQRRKDHAPVEKGMCRWVCLFSDTHTPPLQRERGEGRGDVQTCQQRRRTHRDECLFLGACVCCVSWSLDVCVTVLSRGNTPRSPLFPQRHSYQEGRGDIPPRLWWWSLCLSSAVCI